MEDSVRDVDLTVWINPPSETNRSHAIINAVTFINQTVGNDDREDSGDPRECSCRASEEDLRKGKGPPEDRNPSE